MHLPNSDLSLVRPMAFPMLIRAGLIVPTTTISGCGPVTTGKNALPFTAEWRSSASSVHLSKPNEALLSGAL